MTALKRTAAVLALMGAVGGWMCDELLWGMFLAAITFVGIVIWLGDE